ncbi:T9SS type A sorting domain-containing protein, partial [bacterium]|nr:T9SS type A sorting domain-containing protein [bacterium]
DSYNGAYDVYTGDFDGDDDVDIVGIAFHAGTVTWWEQPGTGEPNEAPGAFSLVSPEDGASFEDLEFPLTFVWDESIDPDGDEVSYTVEFSMDPDFGTTTDVAAGDNTMANVGEEVFDESGTWYWRVKATDDRAVPLSTYSSEEWSFDIEIANQPPGEFSLLLPADGASFIADDFPVTFEWEQSIDPEGGTVTYTVEFSTDPDFTESTEVDAGDDTQVSVGDDVFDESATWYWRVTATDDHPEPLSTLSTEEWSLSIDLGTPAGEHGLPDCWAIASAFPNPFNSAVHITIAAPDRSEARVDVFNLLGRRVDTVWNGALEAGTHTMQWRANGPAGMYFLRLQTASGESDAVRITYVK